MVCFRTSNTQYHTLIRAKSGPQTGKIITQDEPYRTTPQAIRKTVRDKRAFITHDLTFPYIYFVALFYQKKVKKIRKSIIRVFFKNTNIRQNVQEVCVFLAENIFRLQQRNFIVM